MALAEQLGVPLEDVPDMLADDRLDYIRPEGLGLDEEDEGDEDVGAPYTAATVDCYIAAIVEMYHLQKSRGKNSFPHPRGPAVRALLDQRKRDRSQNDRDAFVDRGAEGIGAGYSAKELLLI